MAGNIKGFFTNTFFWTVPLVICLLFVYVFVKINVTVDIALNDIRRETKRAEILQEAIDSIQKQYAHSKYLDDSRDSVKKKKSNM